VRTRIAQDPAPDRNDRLQVEGLVARVLLWGGLLSLALVVLGLGLYAAQGGFHAHLLDLHRAVTPKRDARQPEVFVSLTEVFGGLATRPVDPLAVIALGLVLLLVTPVLGVALAIPGFLAVSDRRYAAIAAIVLTMLVLGTLLAGGVG
jgi:uncharacterized membrane protein